MSEGATKPLSLEELPELRRKTESISRVLKEQLSRHLETLRPLFAPDRVFGRLAGGKVDLPGAERALSEIQQSYKAFTGRPYNLPGTCEPSWLNLVGTALQLHPWDYEISLQGKAVTMSSPVKWVLAYRSDCTLAEVKNALAGKEAVRPEFLRQFVVNALVLQVVLNRNPGLSQLLRALRYELNVEKAEELKSLPVATLTACLSSFRPADDLVLAAVAFSGVPAFIELIDPDNLQTYKDPLREQIEQILKGDPQESTGEAPR